MSALIGMLLVLAIKMQLKWLSQKKELLETEFPVTRK